MQGRIRAASPAPRGACPSFSTCWTQPFTLLLAGLAVVLAGCRQPHVGNVNIRELRAFADVSLGIPAWDGDLLRVPLEVEQKAGDSASVLTWRGVLSEDVITISAHRHLVQDVPPPQEVTVRIRGNLPRRLQVSYIGPDGVAADLGEIEVPDR